MKDLSWKHVAIVAVLIAGIVALVITGHDAGGLAGIALLVFAGIGVIVQQGATAKEQTNGRISDLIRLVEKQSTMLAMQQPPIVPEPEEKPTSEWPTS